MFVTRVISENGLRRKDGGFDLDIRLPWYRALPLSTVVIANLNVDGQAIDKSLITFEVNAKTFPLDELMNHPEEIWFVLDSAFLHVKDAALSSAAEHDVDLIVGLYPPYIPGFYRLTECKKRLTA